ncbi:MAG: L,D-transpeptidase family protein [Calditrichaeota bacterium]|nr:L,D-transpeptidase family protein [Calditrichota bacterium]MCB9367728.1 L,D-transpeptidase family protein [Calditrichota bacterium]
MLRPTVLLTLILSAVLWLGCDTPPLADMVRAESAISNLRDGYASKYAKEELESAELALQKAREEMAYQQGRLSILRGYDSADSLISYARSLAQIANDSAHVRRAESLRLARTELDDLTRNLESWRKSLDVKLTVYRAEKLWSLAQMSQATAVSLLEQEDVDGALDAAQECRDQLSALRDAINNHDADAQERIQVAKKWVNATVSESKKNRSIAIIVDKEEHKLHLIDGGRKIKSYECDLGFNAAYQKMFAGDGATPEGTYRVSEVKQSSRYYKALLLNYPNDDDKKRFAANKRNGRISSRAGIGKLIEIHGHGGQNKNWTDGCVALADNDMLDLMKFARVGTPVTIVRKLEGLQ